MSEPIHDMIQEKHVEAAETAEKHTDTVVPEDKFELTVRDTNNLVRYLFTGGYISYTLHPQVNIILDEMIKWLERQGIRVHMDMERME